MNQSSSATAVGLLWGLVLALPFALAERPMQKPTEESTLLAFNGKGLGAFEHVHEAIVHRKEESALDSALDRSVDMDAPEESEGALDSPAATSFANVERHGVNVEKAVLDGTEAFNQAPAMPALLPLRSVPVALVQRGVTLTDAPSAACKAKTTYASLEVLVTSGDCDTPDAACTDDCAKAKTAKAAEGGAKNDGAATTGADAVPQDGGKIEIADAGKIRTAIHTVDTADTVKDEVPLDKYEGANFREGKKTPEWKGEQGWESEYKELREKHSTHWKDSLNKVVTDNKLADHGMYKDFLVQVMAEKPGRLGELEKSAIAAVGANDDLDQKSLKYVNDLKSLADGTMTGYTNSAINHFYGYDQIAGIIEEGQMAPGRSIKIYLPLDSTQLKFKPCVDRTCKDMQENNPVTKESEDYLAAQATSYIKEKIAKYRGYHFTFCVHASTNLQAKDIPYGAWVDPSQAKEQVPNSGGMTKALQKLLEARSKGLQTAVQKVLDTKMADLNLRKEEYHFPPPLPGSSLHVATEAPAGIVMIVAEDKDHDDDFAGNGQIALKHNASTKGNSVHAINGQYDQKQCHLQDFDAMKNKVAGEEVTQIEKLLGPMQVRESRQGGSWLGGGTTGHDELANAAKLSDAEFKDWVATATHNDNLHEKDEYVRLVTEYRADYRKQKGLKPEQKG